MLLNAAADLKSRVLASSFLVSAGRSASESERVPR